MRLTGLDALRGIAALLVVVGHTSPLMGLTLGKLYLAVDFFFMLSGYVMARTYEGRMGGSGSRRFLWARVKRLWPLMALGTLLALPLSPEPKVVIFGLLFIPTFAGGLAYPLNGPAWSIFFEFFANVLHALGLYRLRTKLMLLLVALLFAVLAWISIAAGTFHFGQHDNGFTLGVARVMISYFLGVVLYRAWKDRPPLNVHPAVTLLAMPVLLLPPIETVLLDLAFVSLACPLLIAGGLRMKAGPLLVFGGAMSFPLYATHIPVRNLYLEAGMSWPVGLAMTLAFAALLAVGPSLWAIAARKHPASAGHAA